MAYKNLTAGGVVVVYTGRVRRLIITVNATMTGAIIVTDGPVTVATITNPPAGSSYQYWDLQTNATINPGALCDITVNVDSGRGPH